MDGNYLVFHHYLSKCLHILHKSYPVIPAGRRDPGAMDGFHRWWNTSL